MNKFMAQAGVPPGLITGELDPIDTIKSFLPLTVPLDITFAEAEEGSRKGVAIILIPREEKKEKQ